MGKFFVKRGGLMHRRFSRRQRLSLAPLVGALAVAAFPAVAERRRQRPLTAVPASNPCYTAAPAIVPPAGAPAGEVSSPKVGTPASGPRHLDSTATLPLGSVDE